MLRRRTLITGIITLLTLLFLNNFWLIKKPVDLEFTLEGVDNATISYKLSDGLFNSKTVSEDFNLAKSSKIRLSNDKLYFKKVKILVNTGISGGGNLLKTSIPTLRKGKYKLEDIKKYKVSDATISKEGDFFYISPKNSLFKIVYDVSGHAQIKFEFEIFIIILVLSYLLSYKLVDYLADFKTLQNKSRIEIIFLVMFFVMLFIPMSYINQDNISKAENRTLTKWKSLITRNGKINYNFGKDYEKWFNDRFNGRSVFLALDDVLKMKLSINYYTKKNLVLNKKNNWLGTNINVKNKVMFTDEELNKALQDVNRIKKICDENNIKLYIFIAPTKEEIYSQKIFNIDYNMYEKSLQIQKYIEQNTNVPVILAYESLKELAKSELVYFKPDHHWTDAGAYQGYLLLMNEIKKDFPNIYISKPSDYEYYYSNKIRVAPGNFYEGRTYKIMDLHDESILDTSYKYFKHKDFDKIQVTTTNCENGCWEHSYKYNKEYPDLYFYGNSFTLNLLQMLPFSFKNTKNIYIPAHQNNSNLELYEEDIKNMKPDVLVLCFSDIANLKRVYKGDK